MQSFKLAQFLMLTELKCLMNYGLTSPLSNEITMLDSFMEYFQAQNSLCFLFPLRTDPQVFWFMLTGSHLTLLLQKLCMMVCVVE